MTTTEILIEARRAGITLRRTADGQILYRSKAAIAPELLTAMREQKGELIAYLKTRGARYCPSCGGGLQPSDADGERLCFTCLWPGAPTRVQ